MEPLREMQESKDKELNARSLTLFILAVATHEAVNHSAHFKAFESCT